MGWAILLLQINFLWVPCPCLPALRALVHASLTSTCHMACRWLRTFSAWRSPPCPPRRQAGPSGNYRPQGTVLNCSPMRPGARALLRLTDGSVTHVFHGGFQAPLAELSFNNHVATCLMPFLIGCHLFLSHFLCHFLHLHSDHYLKLCFWAV